MKRSRGYAENIATGLKTDDMKWIIPAEIDQIKRPTPLDCQQIVFLVRVQIKLPSTRLAVVRRADGWAAMDYQISGIGISDGDIEKPHRWSITEALIRNQLKHGCRTHHFTPPFSSFRQN